MIKISKKAAAYLEDQGINQFRIRVEAGGCSGYSYKLEDVAEGGMQKDDVVYEVDDVVVVIDEKSGTFLKGTTLDYEGGLNGQGFKFSNPNAKGCCGCGNSFNCG